MKTTWYTKSLSEIAPAHNALIHATEYGNYTLCDKKIQDKKGRWFIATKYEFHKSINCPKCLKFIEDHVIYME